jgi:thiopurine S-methyltransferase
MEKDFWLERWRLNQIGFHQADFNPRLVRHWPALSVPQGGTIFVPLCGKSRDMLWFAQAGYRVIGVELATVAIEAFFKDISAPYVVRQQGPLSWYEANGIRIGCGNFFDITTADLVGTNAVFDRGALVALPPEMRRRYVDHLLTVLPSRVEILLLTLEYDQTRVGGPPFSVQRAEVESLYGARCSVTRLEIATTDQVPPHFSAAGIKTSGESTYRIIKDH